MRTRSTSPTTRLQIVGAVLADTFVIATVVGADRVRVRGLRYLDELVEVARRWHIHKRTHIPIWQYETQVVKPFLPR